MVGGGGGGGGGTGGEVREKSVGVTQVASASQQRYHSCWQINGQRR